MAVALVLYDGRGNQGYFSLGKVREIETHMQQFYLYRRSFEEVSGTGLETKKGNCGMLLDEIRAIRDLIPDGIRRGFPDECRLSDKELRKLERNCRMELEMLSLAAQD